MITFTLRILGEIGFGPLDEKKGMKGANVLILSLLFDIDAAGLLHVL